MHNAIHEPLKPPPTCMGNDNKSRSDAPACDLLESSRFFASVLHYTRRHLPKKEGEARQSHGDRNEAQAVDIFHDFVGLRGVRWLAQRGRVNCVLGHVDCTDNIFRDLASLRLHLRQR